MPPIAVGGGAGGHSALTEDIERASWTLEGAAREVDEAAHQLRMAEWWLERALHDAAPPARHAIAVAYVGVGDAIQGAGGATALAREIADAAERLAAVARHYEEAEAAATQRIGAGEWWGRAASDVIEMAAFPARVVYGSIAKAYGLAWRAGAKVVDTAGDLIGVIRPELGLALKGGAGLLSGGAGLHDQTGNALLPDRPPPTTGYFNGHSVGVAVGMLDAPRGSLPSQYEATLGSLAAALGFLEFIGDEPLYAGALPRVGSRSVRPAPQNIEDLISGIDQVSIGTNGAVAIDTITAPDGSRSHVVRIPGTHDFSITQASPFDNRSNVDAVVGRDSDTAQLVRDAMTSAGIAPGEPVMLVGHSQGGIVATTVAADPHHDFSITHVVTAGSPTGRIAHREDVQYLHLSSEQEFVHQLDGVGTPDLPHVTSVVADLRAAADPALVHAGLGLVSTHAVTTYAATARAADASTHASLTSWKAGAQRFLGNGTASTREYEPMFTKRHAPSPQTGPFDGPRQANGLPPIEAPGTTSLPQHPAVSQEFSPGSLPRGHP